MVEAILVMPRNLFYTTDISVTLWIVNRNKKERAIEINGKIKKYRNRQKEILFMDLRQIGEPFEKKFTQFGVDDIKNITDTYHNWQQISPLERGFEDGVCYKNIPEFCYSAGFDELEKKDFSLVPSKYIEFINRDENIDFDHKMQTLQTEFATLLQAESKSKNDLLTVFKQLGYEI